MASGFLERVFFGGTVTGSRYLEMLNIPSVLGETIEFNDGRLIWLQDGAPPHGYRPPSTVRWLGRRSQRRRFEDQRLRAIVDFV